MFGFAESPAKFVSPRRDDAVIPRYYKEDEQKDAEKIPPKACFVLFPYSILCGNADRHDSYDEDQRDDEARIQRRVDAVEDPAMPREEISHILDAEFALEAALHEVAELRERGGEHADPDEEDEIVPFEDGRAQRELRESRQRHALAEPVVEEEHRNAAQRAADKSAHTADDRLVRADVGRHFHGIFFAQRLARRIGEHVRKRADDEHEGDRDVRIVFQMVAHRHDDEEHRGIHIRDKRTADRFQTHFRRRKDEHSENDRNSRDEHDERDVRRVVAPRCGERVIGKFHAENIGKEDIRHDIHDDDEQRERHGDDLLRTVHSVAEGADHFKRAERRKEQNEHVEEEPVHKEFEREKQQQNGNVHNSRIETELRVGVARFLRFTLGRRRRARVLLFFDFFHLFQICPRFQSFP